MYNIANFRLLTLSGLEFAVYIKDGWLTSIYFSKTFSKRLVLPLLNVSDHASRKLTLTIYIYITFANMADTFCTKNNIGIYTR